MIEGWTRREALDAATRIGRLLTEYRATVKHDDDPDRAETLMAIVREIVAESTTLDGFAHDLAERAAIRAAVLADLADAARADG